MLLLCHAGGSLLHPGLNTLLDLEKEKNINFFLLFINTLIAPCENEDDLQLSDLNTHARENQALLSYSL